MRGPHKVSLLFDDSAVTIWLWVCTIIYGWVSIAKITDALAWHGIAHEYDPGSDFFLAVALCGGAVAAYMKVLAVPGHGTALRWAYCVIVGLAWLPPIVVIAHAGPGMYAHVELVETQAVMLMDVFVLPPLFWCRIRPV